jgi:hypothetical protein
MYREAEALAGSSPLAISPTVGPSLPPEFLHRPVNDEGGLRIRLFRFPFDRFSHYDSLPRIYIELLALPATKY